MSAGPLHLSPASNLKVILRAVIVVIIIGLLVNLLIAFLLDSKMIFRALRRVNYVVLIVPFLCYFMTYIIDALRLRLILSQFGYKVSFANRFYNSVIGGFFSNLTPLASGGQPFQVFHLQSVGVDLKISTNIILSRFVEYVLTSLVILAVSFRYAIAFTASIGTGRYVIYLGLGISAFFGAIFLGVLFRPDILGKTALMLEKSGLGRLVSRIIKKEGWGETFIAWSYRLREEVNFLWTEKLHIMVIDILLGLVNLVLQVFSLQYVITTMTKTTLPFIKFFVTFVIANLVVYYVPTPGGSGSVESIYSLLFSGLTGYPGATFISVVVWRFATYYLHIFFGLFLFIVFMRRAQARQIADQVAAQRKPGADL